MWTNARHAHGNSLQALNTAQRASILARYNVALKLNVPAVIYRFEFHDSFIAIQPLKSQMTGGAFGYIFHAALGKIHVGDVVTGLSVKGEFANYGPIASAKRNVYNRFTSFF